ncbi:DUF1775 domain-containing protein [Paracoccus ravus]|uniref:DUF1775 domain-containing protein n=1 Tax=Paracoccus ravus TaxID=2447760 RepID=UPI00106EAADF|nr:DUF1775 domain-containing protein [Paracoccus ravus]
MKNHIIAATLSAATLLSVGPARAHATLETAEAAVGSSYRAVIRIGHGCDGKPTKTLRVQLPEGFYSAKPMPKPGWTIKTVTGNYARPFDDHGRQVRQGVREIIWSGGDLPDDFYDEFVFRGTVGPDLVPGSTIYFPTIQECGMAKAAWIDVTGAAEADNPAPALRLTEAKAPAHAHGHHDSASHPAAETRVGEIVVSDAYSRATPPGAPVGGAYLTLTNAGADPDRLIGASTPLAGRVEIHEMAMEGEVMRMRKLDDGLVLPAGESVALQPGGFHLMLFDLKEPLVEGATLEMELEFEHAGIAQISLTVGPMNAGGGHGGH